MKPADPGDNLPRALAWMVLSGLSFALMGASVKLAGDVPLSAKVFFRNLVTLGLTTAVALRAGSNPLAPTPHWRLLVLRSLSGLAGVALYFLALGRMQLADASLLNKTSPFFVALLAPLVISERFERAMGPVLLVAFAGAALVIKPGLESDPWPALAGLGSGLFAGLAYVLVRALRGRETPNRIIFTFSLISTLATLPFVAAARPDPTGGQWLALLGTGVFAAGGQYGLTFAYHHARASRVAVFTYLHVVFAATLGALIWAERPDALSLTGGLLIVGAAWRTHQLGRRA